MFDLAKKAERGEDNVKIEEEALSKPRREREYVTEGDLSCVSFTT